MDFKPSDKVETADTSESIPISEARELAQRYGYDQVIIIARKTGENGREHVTTFGHGEHAKVAAQCGDFLKFKVMGWDRDSAVMHENEVGDF